MGELAWERVKDKKEYWHRGQRKRKKGVLVWCGREKERKKVDWLGGKKKNKGLFSW